MVCDWYFCRWSLIAGRIPGRTDNEIKNYWNAHLGKKIQPEKSKAGHATLNVRPSDEAEEEDNHIHDSKVVLESSEESLVSQSISTTSTTTTEESSWDILMDFNTREISLSEFLDTDFTKFSNMISSDKILKALGEGAVQIQTQLPYEANDEAPDLISWEADHQIDSDFGYQLSAAFTDFVADQEEYWSF